MSMWHEHDTKETEKLKAVWVRLMPGTTLPDDLQFEIWLTVHPPTVVRYAIVQLASKNRQGPMTDDHRIKFASAVMNRIAKQQRAGIPIPAAVGNSSITA